MLTAAPEAEATERIALTSEQLRRTRDPFRRGRHLMRQASRSKPQQQATPVEPPPTLKFVACLIDDGGRLALLEDDQGETFICKEGDEIRGVKLVNIERAAIKMRYKSQSYSLDLE